MNSLSNSSDSSRTSLGESEAVLDGNLSLSSINSYSFDEGSKSVTEDHLNSVVPILDTIQNVRQKISELKKLSLLDDLDFQSIVGIFEKLHGDKNSIEQIARQFEALATQIYQDSQSQLEQIEKLGRVRDSLESEKENILRFLEEEKGKTTQLSLEFEETKNELSSTIELAERYRQSAETAVCEVERLQRSVAEVQQSWEADRSVLNDHLDKLTRENKSLSDANELAIKRHQDFIQEAQESSQRQQKIDQIEMERRSWLQERTTLTAKITDTLRKSEEKISGLERKLSQLHRRLSERDNELALIESELGARSTQIRELKKTIAENEVQFLKLQEALVILEQEKKVREEKELEVLLLKKRIDDLEGKAAGSQQVNGQEIAKAPIDCTMGHELQEEQSLGSLDQEREGWLTKWQEYQVQMEQLKIGFEAEKKFLVTKLRQNEIQVGDLLKALRSEQARGQVLQNKIKRIQSQKELSRQASRSQNVDLSSVE